MVDELQRDVVNEILVLMEVHILRNARNEEQKLLPHLVLTIQFHRVLLQPLQDQRMAHRLFFGFYQSTSVLYTDAPLLEEGVLFAGVVEHNRKRLKVCLGVDFRHCADEFLLGDKFDHVMGNCVPHYQFEGTFGELFAKQE